MGTKQALRWRMLLLAALMLLMGALACGPAALNPGVPTLDGSPAETRAAASASPVAPTAPAETPIAVCTPPACSPDEVYFCPESCPGGCGTICATVTPRPPLEGLWPEGPWLVMATAGDGGLPHALWAANPDGSGLTRLTGPDEYLIWPYDLSRAVGGRGRVAFITASDSYLHNLTLHRITLPGLDRQIITPLTSIETEPPPGDAAISSPQFDIVRAIADVQSLAWSHNGQILAFMSSHAGSSSDLYVYSPDEETIVRLTNGPSQGIKPEWSPDDRYVVHFGVSSLGTGAGYGMQGAWAAAADGSQVITLYEPDSGDEGIFGWPAAGTMLVASWHPDCGWQNLRTLEIETGREALRWAGCFTDAVVDSYGERVLIAVDESVGQIDPDSPAGLHLVNLGELGALTVSESPAYEVSWNSPTYSFYARTADGLLTVSPDGQRVQAIDLQTALPVIAPEGETWALPGAGFEAPPGLWLGPANPASAPAQVFAEPVSAAAWSPDGRHLLFFGGGGLYVIRNAFREAQPELIQPGFIPIDRDSMAWVWP